MNQISDLGATLMRAMYDHEEPRELTRAEARDRRQAIEGRTLRCCGQSFDAREFAEHTAAHA